ncbi:hypothetical protein E3N88_18609 [Mikania micrantha]|uniref:Uncharacterized protein n=1 Tax=Mikania micrantha TaxID=192012 RepID=A0A5N6NMQ8_9ASTR|nr:hypothetical protein E3N88_18609 [Mikania micrantha]
MVTEFMNYGQQTVRAARYIGQARSRPSLRACTHASRATRLATEPGAFPQGCPKVPPPNCSTESSPKISVRAGICQTLQVNDQNDKEGGMKRIISKKRGSLTIVVAHHMYAMPPYPYLATDYGTQLSLFTHHMWIGGFLIVAAAAHATIFMVRDTPLFHSPGAIYNYPIKNSQMY